LNEFEGKKSFIEERDFLDGQQEAFCESVCLEEAFCESVSLEEAFCESANF
jgi:hypothetical protein